MAADVYLWIEGVKGESKDDKHKDWIELVSADWRVIQPTSGIASTGGGHTIGRAEFKPVGCTKTVDLASPSLMQLCAAGKTVPKAKLEFVRADGSNPLTYYVLELENVLVSNSGKTFASVGLLHEAFELSYTKITEKYTQQKTRGGAGGNTSGSWNLSTNKAG